MILFGYVIYQVKMWKILFVLCCAVMGVDYIRLPAFLRDRQESQIPWFIWLQ